MPHAADGDEERAETLCWPLVRLACKHPEQRAAARDTLLAGSRLKPALWVILEWMVKEAAAVQSLSGDVVRTSRSPTLPWTYCYAVCDGAPNCALLSSFCAVCH
jgi:hypothetical protein